MAIAAPGWRIRPRQRGRAGFKALTLDNRPTASELAYDKLVVTVPGHVTRIRHDAHPQDDPVETGLLIDSYRDAIGRRSALTGAWGLPGAGPDYFKTKLLNPVGTISGAQFNTKLAHAGLGILLTMTLNPTRTLIHALASVQDEPDATVALARLSPELFFARSPRAVSARTLDGSDNAIHDLTYVVDRLGSDFAGTFTGIFEQKLKQWALNAVAPDSVGFSHLSDGVALAGTDGLHGVMLHWDRLYPAEAEVYFERRHGAAPGLMDRLTTAIMASHSNCEWRRYPLAEIGGRQNGATSIGVKPTERTKLVFYAKTADRLRVEMRFSYKVKDNLRNVTISPSTPITDILFGLRDKMLSRLEWDSLCEMVAEQPEPRIEDGVALIGEILRCCRHVHVRHEPVVNALLGTDGFEATDRLGDFPPELVSKLERDGLVSNVGVTTRVRPGETRRHHLLEPHATVAQALRRGFAIPTGVDGNGRSAAPDPPRSPNDIQTDNARRPHTITGAQPNELQRVAQEADEEPQPDTP